MTATPSIERTFKRLRLLPAATLVLVAAVGMPPAMAEMLCFYPQRPSCLISLSIMRDEITLQACRSSVESYRRQVNDFLQCQQLNATEIVRDLNSTINKFNGCARSEIC